VDASQLGSRVWSLKDAAAWLTAQGCAQVRILLFEEFVFAKSASTRPQHFLLFRGLNRRGLCKRGSSDTSNKSKTAGL
jgi:hypothetical protein